MKTLWMALGGVLWLAAGSCGSDNNNQQPGVAGTDFSGRYEGTEQGTEGGVPFETRLTVTLTRTGDQFSGNYVNGLGGNGTVTGTVTGNTANLTAVAATGCRYSGNATSSGERITGRLNAPASTSCPAFDATFDVTRGTPPPTPAPPPTGTPPPAPPSGTPDWSSVTLTTTQCLGDNESSCATVRTFTIDDNGNSSISPPSRGGRITESDLLRVDSRIDAIKEEAHEPFSCVQGPPFNGPGYSLSLTFSNRGNAIVYRTRPLVGEECWSGDRAGVFALLSEILTLESAAG